MTKPAYLLINVRVIDAVQYEKYKIQSSAAALEYGAEICARGGTTEVLEGDWQPNRVVLFKFKDTSTAKAFYNSETYQNARQLRAKAAVMQMVLLEGMDVLID